MTDGSWLCLLAPLGGTIAILLGGTRIPRGAAAWISTTSVFVAFGGAVWAFLGVHSAPQPQCIGTVPCNLPRGEITTAWTWLQSGNFHVGLQLLVDPLSTVMMLIVSGVGGLIVLYSIGYMDGDERGAPLLRVHLVLRLLDAATRRGRQPAHAARRLGARRPLVLPPDRLLA